MTRGTKRVIKYDAWPYIFFFIPVYPSKVRVPIGARRSPPDYVRGSAEPESPLNNSIFFARVFPLSSFFALFFSS